jgi:ECF transporter S component (folate family)
MSKKSIFSKEQLFKIILTSILVALDIILERFLAYSVWNNTVSFGFVTVAFAACYLGVPYAMAVAGLGDFIGAIIKPFGPYFVGFTITNLMVGLIFGLFFYKNATILKIGGGVIVSKIVSSLILNTIWVSILYRGGIDAFWAVFVTRVPFTAVMAVVEIIVISLLFSNKSKTNRLIKKTLSH